MFGPPAGTVLVPGTISLYSGFAAIMYVGNPFRMPSDSAMEKSGTLDGSSSSNTRVLGKHRLNAARKTPRFAFSTYPSTTRSRVKKLAAPFDRVRRVLKSNCAPSSLNTASSDSYVGREKPNLGIV